MKFLDWMAAAVASLDVDPGVKLCYISLYYDIFGIIPLYEQNHTLGLFLLIVVNAYRDIVNHTRGKTEGSGGVRAGVV